VRSGRIDDVPRAVRAHAAALPLTGRRPLDILLDRRAPAAAGAVAEV
jgi:hypothetical protein